MVLNFYSMVDKYIFRSMEDKYIFYMINQDMHD